MLEKHMENAIATMPEKYLSEQGLTLLARQYTIGHYRFDLLFEDRHGGKLIVEIQRGTLNRSHCYKIFDYYDEYKEKFPQDFIELMVVANNIPEERKKRLSSRGVTYVEIPEREFCEMQTGTTESNEVIIANDEKLSINTNIIDYRNDYKSAWRNCSETSLFLLDGMIELIRETLKGDIDFEYSKMHVRPALGKASPFIRMKTDSNHVGAYRTTDKVLYFTVKQYKTDTAKFFTLPDIEPITRNRIKSDLRYRFKLLSHDSISQNRDVLKEMIINSWKMY